MDEFELIRCFFERPFSPGIVSIGIGDDAAVLNPRPGRQSVVCTDTLVEGRHFLIGTSAHAIGWKCLAVNLSDLAAMGAEPIWATLALTLPEADPIWLKDFSTGFFELADATGVVLVGGDTTRGSCLTITVTVGGDVPMGQAIRRGGAHVGDTIWVSGFPGEAAASLRQRVSGQPEPERWCRHLDYPQPRLDLARQLRGQVHAMIDISDGLLQDMGHILKASQVGAVVEEARLPRHTQDGLKPLWEDVLCGGDDYELLWTAAEDCFWAGDVNLPLTRIGRVVAEPGLRVLGVDGQLQSVGMTTGYRHF